MRTRSVTITIILTIAFTQISINKFDLGVRLCLEMDLLKELIVVSEKAANVARLCRQNEHLFKLLIQKKCADEANPRFVDDFKTLADVLIQQLVKHDVGNKVRITISVELNCKKRFSFQNWSIPSGAKKTTRSVIN